MTFQEYYRSLPSDEREIYVKNIGLNRRYVEIHFVSKVRRHPRERIKQAMVNFSNGHLSYEDVCNSFRQSIANT